MTFFHRLLAASPIVLFVVVALHQHVLAGRSTLSRWKGGGMGMYSEQPNVLRALVVSFHFEDGQDISFPLRHNEWPPVNYAARAFPRPASLRRIVREIRGLKWVYRNEQRSSIEGVKKDRPYPDHLVIHPQRIVVEARETVYRPEGLTVERKILDSYEARW